MRYKKDYGTCQAPAITDQDGVFVAMMFNEGELSNQLEEAEAEKALSLFTAAPELLETCEAAFEALQVFGLVTGEGDLMDTLKNVIAKAKG